MGEWYSRRGHFVLALDPCLIYEINGRRQRNQPNFVPVRLFLPQSNNSETVSILSKWVNTDLMDDRRFLLKYNDSENFITDASVFR